MVKEMPWYSKAKGMATLHLSLETKKINTGK
jgi:hypothetical protein